jgi:hypothetical protein
MCKYVCMHVRSRLCVHIDVFLLFVPMGEKIGTDINSENFDIETKFTCYHIYM